MSLLDLISQSYHDIGAAKAGAAERVGQIWATAAQSLGQIPAQIQEQKTRDLQNQVTQTQLQGLQAAQASQQRASQALQGIPRNPDGTFDIGQLDDALAKANVLPEDHERLLTSFGKVNDTIKSWRQAQLDHTASIADSILSAHGLNDPVTWDAVNQGLAQAKVMGLATDAEAQQFAQLQASGADPVQVLKTIRSQGSKFSGPTKYTPLPANSGGVLNEATGQVTPTGVSAVPKTEAELAADAANPESPTALRSAAALKMLKGASAQNEWAAFQQATAQKLTGKPDATFADLTPAQQLKAVEDFKLIGPEAAAAAAAGRQADTQAQQNKLEGDRQLFEVQKEGRSQLDKAEDTLGKARASAALLRQTVEAAQSGNKIAATEQQIQQALATVRSQGISRVPNAEIGATKGAGNVFDKFEGLMGRLVSGQPVDASLQSDMKKYADLLEEASIGEYTDKFNSVTKRYKMTDEKPVAVPGQTAQAGGGGAPQTRTATINGQKVTFTRGPKGWTSPDLPGAVYDDKGQIVKGGV